MDSINIGIVHNVPVASFGKDAKASDDVMVQVDAIDYVLKKEGYVTRKIPFTRDLDAFLKSLQKERVDVIFNLCETVDEDATMAAHPAAVFELLGIPFTGSPVVALTVTTDKVMTKRLLTCKGIKTPHYLIYNGSDCFNASYLEFPVIVKPRYEDASIGIDQESIFRTEKKLKGSIKDFYDQFGSLIVEEYIDGREFNISLFGYPEARIMPIAEIDFSEFSSDLYRIVGYKAKWDEKSFEYHHTRRKFSSNLSGRVLEELHKVAFDCYTYFMLRDYARVDMRVDPSGKVYVLEINANPCISPDAGFSAALAEAGITYTKMVQSFMSFLIQRSSYGNQTVCLSRKK